MILIERAIELEINDGANVSDSEIDIVVLHAAQVQCAIYQKNTMIAQRRYRVFLTESSSFTCSALLLDNASTDYSIEIHLMGAAASAHFTGVALELFPSATLVGYFTCSNLQKFLSISIIIIVAYI